MTLPQFKIEFDPIANPKAVVQRDNVRCTVLTDRLIRMEHSPSGEFEDHASMAIWYRNQPVPPFTAKVTDESVEIDTDYLHLTYRVNRDGFTPTSLSVTVKQFNYTWHYGDHPYFTGNLGGTYRTLDEASGFVRPDPGLMSSKGGAVHDDSKTLVFNEDCWVEPRAQPENKDLYFFGYGHDFTACQLDLTKIAGKTPMVPRYILGNWWSRYWAFSDQELLDLMQEFKDHDTPLSVCIVDMDWHVTKEGNTTSSGWTGYTWNRKLFPNPEGFIEKLHDLGLKTALNLHPADGIHPHEAQHKEFAEFMGMDPEIKEPIPFDIADPKFAEGYFNILHHPMEAQGVDFWWIDWQQGGVSSLPGLDPLTWLNHLHFYDLGRDGEKRPFIFSRWGGLGGHRYPIGFSGDTVIGWDALAFQPGFTAVAANVGYGYWSHDIGGHMGGVEEDELYARWMQYGVFSPIFRMHCTSNPFHERRPWGRGPAAEKAATAALQLRHSLIPYIYSMSWRNYSTGQTMICPLYYTHPNEDTFQMSALGAYWFGSELVAAPFTQPASEETGLSKNTIYLPEGTWFNFFSGERVQGNGWKSIYGTLDDIPVFAKAGAIVPMSEENDWGQPQNPVCPELVIFPGADNVFELYEDDGETNDYQNGAYAITRIEQQWKPEELILTIHPVAGKAEFIPEGRQFGLTFKGIKNPDDVVVKRNGEAVEVDGLYDAVWDALMLTEVEVNPADELVVTLKGDLLATSGRSKETVFNFLTHFKMDSWDKNAIYNHWEKIKAGEMSLKRFHSLTDAQAQVLESLM
ncbi:MAG: TIM-barrel domain-containing protein [Anaerolineae bacterium]|jgi:alpha-glucosidase (family GH31 glycosyl hydrolase)|nr:TIM-barrel domain-containing protein [Anaerolineae bacterium]